MYSLFIKCYQIARYAQNTYGDKVTLEQLETSVTMIIQTVEPRTINKYVESVQKDFSPVCKPQIKKIDQNTYLVTPNYPLSPNHIIDEAWNSKHP